MLTYEMSQSSNSQLKGYDPYEVLGVPHDASKEQIKKAYRTLARYNHPDKNQGNPQAQKRFILISKSYECFATKAKL